MPYPGKTSLTVRTLLSANRTQSIGIYYLSKYFQDIWWAYTLLTKLE